MTEVDWVVEVSVDGHPNQDITVHCESPEEAVRLRDRLVAGDGLRVVAYAPEIYEVEFSEGRRPYVVSRREIQARRDL